MKETMATNDVDKFPDDDFPTDFKDIDQNTDFVPHVVVLTPPVQLTPPPQDRQTTVHHGCSFNEKTFEPLLAHFRCKIKVGKNANRLFAELMRIYSVEIITRAGELAINEGSSKFTGEHFEKVLPQFLLDFN